MEKMESNEPIVPVPAPWKLKGTVYFLSFWTNKASSAKGKRNDGLPTIAYSPLEAASPFANPAISGEHLGGLSQIQIIRYTDSPVGPYDELIVCPGYFEYEKDVSKGRTKKTKNARITRIYVSQKYTCWNGRTNWNIPKHLARFEWDHSLDGKTRVRVYAYDTEEANDDSYSATSESEPSKKFFFQATFQPVRWAPSFPLSFSWLKYVGIDASLVQPPLPDGSQNSSWGREELPGTSRWCKVLPGLSTKRATLGWMDMSQDDATHDGGGGGVKSGSGYDTEYDNFWPGLRRWNVAIKMQNTDINFGEGLYWDRPKSKLGL